MPVAGVDRLRLDNWLGTENAKNSLTMAGYRGPQAEIAFLRDNDAQQRAFAENYVGLPY